MQSLLISTTNPGKFAELVALLDELPVKLISPKDLGVSLDVNESGDTYAQNAALKARAFADASHILSIADDTGLEVDALDGLPGLNSARFTAAIALRMQNGGHCYWQSCMKSRNHGWRIPLHGGCLHS